MPQAPDGRDMVHPMTRAEWRAWLAENHGRTEGVWVAAYRKATGKPRVDYADIVEEALAYGWIDSRANKLDDERSLLWLAPRNPKSGWSRVNKDRIAKLERAGLMAAPGRRAVGEAKRSGAWSSLDKVEALEIPPDLARALAQNETAKTYFEAFPPSSKKIILGWIETAKRPETRSRRIDETVRLAARNERANHRR